jgi:hypothetical protein
LELAKPNVGLLCCRGVEHPLAFSIYKFSEAHRVAVKLAKDIHL